MLQTGKFLKYILVDFVGVFAFFISKIFKFDLLVALKLGGELAFK